MRDARYFAQRFKEMPYDALENIRFKLNEITNALDEDFLSQAFKDALMGEIERRKAACVQDQPRKLVVVTVTGGVAHAQYVDTGIDLVLIDYDDDSEDRILANIQRFDAVTNDGIVEILKELEAWKAANVVPYTEGKRNKPDGRRQYDLISEICRLIKSKG